MSDNKTKVAQLELQKQASQAQRGREAKLQMLGRQIVSTLYMLVRNVKMYDPDNDIFAQPFENLKNSINTIVAMEGLFQLNAVAANVYVNSKQLQIDFHSLENVKFLTEEFKNRDVGGFNVNRQVSIQELKDFVWIFSPQNSKEPEEKGVEGRFLANIRVGKFARIVEQIDKMEEGAIDAERKVDRKKYAMTVYARAVYYMRRFIEKTREEGGQFPSVAPAARLIRDLVDISFEQRSHFLGMTSTRSDGEYVLYHSVNTALISIVFGTELGMSKSQLHELGMAALFHDIGMSELGDDILSKKGGLTRAERALVDLYPLHTVKMLLRSRTLDSTMIKQIIASYEAKVDYSVPMKGQDGKVRLMLPKVELGIFGRIINISACYDALTSARPFRDPYGPEVALTLMMSEMKYKFDPWLLQVFMKVMAVQPVRILEQAQRTFRVGQ